MEQEMSARTMVCVHAHPDDEALFTAGVQAHYGRQGVRQVLITCTTGGLGFDAEGRSSIDHAHDAEIVAATRAEELSRSCEILGIDRVEQLGYDDSGMAGWKSNLAETAFVNQSVDEVSAKIAKILEEERPQVVVTYGSDGFYGHPDHIQTHIATMAAVEKSPWVQRVYFVAFSESTLKRCIEKGEAGMSLPDWLRLGLVQGVHDELMETSVDCSDVVELKHRALRSHASQSDNDDLVALPKEVFVEWFGTETYLRGYDTTGSPLPETDLFAGVVAH